MNRLAAAMLTFATLVGGCFIDADDDDDTDIGGIETCHIDCDEEYDECDVECVGNVCAVDCQETRDECYTDCD
jgi:hypothetical protein